MQIEIRNLSVKREEKEVFKKLQLKLQSGHIHSICGNTGSGKTMLLQAIAGILPESEGAVFAEGQPIKAHQIAMAQQKAVLYNHMTGFDYLQFLQVSSSPWIRELNNYFNLPLHQSTDYYSYGMLHQLRIMGAFAEQKPITLLDEPFNNLDENNILYLKKVMKTIIGPTRTIITTHANSQLATGYANKIHILSDAVIKESTDNSYPHH